MSATGFDFAKGSEKAWRFEGPDCRGSKVWENVKLKTAEGIGAIPGLKALRLLFDELASNGLEGSTAFRSRGIFAGHQGALEIIAFLPGFPQRDERIRPEGGLKLFPAMPVLQTPELRAVGVYQDIKAAAVKELPRLRSWSGAADFSIGQWHGGTKFRCPHKCPQRLPLCKLARMMLETAKTQ